MRMGFFSIFFLLFPEDDDFAVLFWSASSDRPRIIYYVNLFFQILLLFHTFVDAKCTFFLIEVILKNF
jgi:hypothetical protein